MFKTFISFSSQLSAELQLLSINSRAVYAINCCSWSNEKFDPSIQFNEVATHSHPFVNGIAYYFWLLLLLRFICVAFINFLLYILYIYFFWFRFCHNYNLLNRVLRTFSGQLAAFDFYWFPSVATVAAFDSVCQKCSTINTFQFLLNPFTCLLLQQEKNNFCKYPNLCELENCQNTVFVVYILYLKNLWILFY